MSFSLSENQIRSLFEKLNQKLAKQNIKGELYLVGGAVMCLIYKTRSATKDIDALFLPKTTIRKAADEIAKEEAIDSGWLIDAVKAYLSPKSSFNPFIELSHLQVLAASPEYLLAMKCLAMRIGKEFHDEADIRYLLRYLNISSYKEALKVIARYYPIKQFPQKTLYALEEMCRETF